ncbi:MAG: hypothetical protein ACK4LQ_11320 [Pararhodobacter sp.]
MDELFIAELRERLFAHFVAGCWRVPLAQRHLVVGGFSGALGQIVCAGAGDIARARAAERGESAAPDALWRALEARAEGFTHLRAHEGWPDDHLMRRALPVLPPVAGAHGWVLLSGAGCALRDLAALLIAGACGGGMIWKPAPAAAASAHLMMDAIGPLAGGRLAMVQGDHATGALLAEGAALLWASPAPPPADLPAPVFSLRTISADRR